MKRITMKDIAKEAGVSVATVSYVINNIEAQKIPTETREKILSIASRLDYVPNLTARALVKKRSGMIGIFIMTPYSSQRPWEYFYFSRFVAELEALLTKSGFHVLIRSMGSGDTELDIITQRALDGVFILGADRENFYRISTKFSVPIIVVDGYIEDKFFHELVFDYENALQKAKALLKEEHPYLIASKIGHKDLLQQAAGTASISSEDIYYVNSLHDLADVDNFITPREPRKGIIINEHLAAPVVSKHSPSSIAVICNTGAEAILPPEIPRVVLDNAKKAKEAHRLIIDYINGDYSEQNYTVIQAE